MRDFLQISRVDRQKFHFIVQGFWYLFNYYKMFTEEHRIIIKYLRIKYGDGAKKIVKDHPEFDWKVEKIDVTGSIARKEGNLNCGIPSEPTTS